MVNEKHSLGIKVWSKYLVLILSIFFTFFSCFKVKGQFITTFAGNGYGAGLDTGAYSGDGGPATTARLFWPFEVVFDASGNFYIADEENFCIRKINTSHIISTFSGDSGSTTTVHIGFFGDGGAATRAEFNVPIGVSIDPSGNTYIADYTNYCVRKINTLGTISTFAGSYTLGPGFSGDGGSATAAEMQYPYSFAFDASGNVYISDDINNRIRKVNSTTHIITTVAGSGPGGYGTGSYSGDGGAATAATLNEPGSMAFDASGNMYIADGLNNRIRKVNTLGIISTFAGTGTAGYSGDGGPATAAKLNDPNKICLDKHGNLYVSDGNNNMIRKINTSGIISRVAGNGTAGYTGDHGLALSAEFNLPQGLTFDTCGNLYIADYYNNVIREVGLSAGVITGPNMVCIGSTITLTDSGVSGGTWHSSDSTKAAVASGVVTGVALGTAVISYTVTNACGTYMAVDTITVKSRLGAITGTDSVCVGDTLHLADTTSGGVWASDYTALATIGLTGITTGVSWGADTITYHETSTGCTVTFPLKVLRLATAIGGLDSVCVGNNITLTDSVSGGTWSVSSGAYATINDSTGVLHGLISGTDTVTYNTFCGHVKKVITINAIPTFLGSTQVCTGNSITLSATPALGLWTTDSAEITLGASTGLVTGVSAGLARVTYTSTTGCVAYDTVTVYGSPSVSVTPALAIYCSTPDTMTSTTTGGTGPYNYTWAAATGLSATTGSRVICSGIGSTTTYTVTVHDSHSCTASAISTVSVPCNSICTGSGVTLLGAHDTIAGGSYSGGVFYIDDGLPGATTIYITASLTFLDAVVSVAPNKTLKVSPGVTFTITGTHVFCCATSYMWGGIQLATNSSGTSTAFLTIDQYSLIEDATVAVDITGAYTGASAILYSDGTVFNRNTIAININSFASTSTSYPFTLTNNTFTSRRLDSFYNSGSGLTYPFAWPVASTLNGLYTPPSPVNPPVFLDDSTAKNLISGTRRYYKIQCKNGADANIGIKLTGVGPATSTTYPGIVVGAGGGPINLFDNLNYGICDTNSNLTVLGAYFTYIHVPTGLTTPTYGTGIQAINTAPGSSGHKYALRVNTSAHTSGNQCYFYNNRMGVNCSEFRDVICVYNSAYSTHTDTAYTTLIGANGFSIASATFDTININYDTLVNIENAIAYTSTTDGNTGAPGIVNMNYNTITGQATYYAHGYTIWGITVNNGLTGSGRTGYIYANYNTMNNVYSGIYVNSFQRRYAYTNNNAMVMVNNSHGIGSSTISGQWGILHSNCAKNNICNNYIQGYAGAPSMSAVGGQNNANDTVTCNEELTCNKGYNFTGISVNPTIWNHNDMNGNSYGLYLGAGGAFIGLQGSFPTSPSDNTWSGTWSGAGIWQTYNAFPAPYNLDSSILFVRPSSPYLPTVNGTLFGAVGNTYTLGTSIIELLGSLPGYVSCVPTNTRHAYRTYEATVTNAAALTTPLAAQVGWIAEKAAYDGLQMDDSILLDSSNLLVVFDTLAAYSRFPWLDNIESNLDTGNYSLAETLMNNPIDSFADTTVDITGVIVTDGTLADVVVGNYLEYDWIYDRFMQGTMTSIDSSNIITLANLCPNRDGFIVYKARALVNILYGTIIAPDDSCNFADSTAWRKAPNAPVKNTINQKYSLHPNPSDGNITITQTVIDNQLVNAEIYNATGKVIYKGQLQFDAQSSKLHLNNVIPGLYLLQLTDCKGAVFNLKFIIN